MGIFSWIGRVFTARKPRLVETLEQTKLAPAYRERATSRSVQTRQFSTPVRSTTNVSKPVVDDELPIHHHVSDYSSYSHHSYSDSSSSYSSSSSCDSSSSGGDSGGGSCGGGD